MLESILPVLKPYIKNIDFNKVILDSNYKKKVKIDYKLNKINKKIDKRINNINYELLNESRYCR